MRRTWLVLPLALSLPAPALAFPEPGELDRALVQGANSWGAPALDAPMHLLSNSAFVVAVPLALAWLPDRTLGAPAVVGVSEVLALGATFLLKPVFARPRPYEAIPSLRTPDGQMPDDPYSLPSGHALISFAAAAALADARPAYAVPAYALAALISYSRMYNGLHYPSDLLAGAAIGFGIGKLSRWGYDRLPSGWGLPALSLAAGDGFMLGISQRF